MDDPLKQYSSLIPIVEKVATDIATQVVTEKLNEAQYNVPKIPDHHHNGTDSIQLEPEALTFFEPLPATTGGIVNPTVLQNQVVGQDTLLVGYGNLNVGRNQLIKGNFTTFPIPIIYGHGVGTDSAFNEGTAPYGTVVFFENGATLSGLWVNTVNGWYRLATGSVAPAAGKFVAATTTNGTSPVSVFVSGSPGTAITITGVYLISNDGTAGNITVENPASTVVATIAKGTVSGAMVGATSLSSTSVASGTNLIVKSSSAGNATVFVTYTT